MNDLQQELRFECSIAIRASTKGRSYASVPVRNVGFYKGTEAGYGRTKSQFFGMVDALIAIQNYVFLLQVSSVRFLSFSSSRQRETDTYK